MSSPAPNSSLWEAIDLSESFLVSGMLDDATSLSSSVLRRLRSEGEEIDRPELADMTTSAAMVLVQSLKGLGRTVDIFSELEGLSGSVAYIPCQVIITGACMQLSEGLVSNLKPLLEFYLGLWKVADEQSLVPKVYDKHLIFGSCLDGPCLSMEEYLEVVDIYAFQLLGLTLHDVNLAIAWTENAEIPEEKRQDLLRKLHSLYSAKSSISSAGVERLGHVKTVSNSPNVNGTKEYVEVHYGKSSSKIAKIRALQPCFWWPRMIYLRCQNNQLLLQCGKATVFGILIILISYILRKKWTIAQRTATRRLNSIKRVLIDAWQLAFSVNVNPLAAVQPLTAPAAPGRR